MPFARHLRSKHRLCEEGPSKSWVLYLEDIAPCHVGDRCKQTGDTGLQQVRRELFAEEAICRECNPANGTPETAAPDQGFRIVKMLHAESMKELVGLQNDLAQRPSGDGQAFLVLDRRS